MPSQWSHELDSGLWKVLCLLEKCFEHVQDTNMKVQDVSMKVQGMTRLCFTLGEDPGEDYSSTNLFHRRRACVDLHASFLCGLFASIRITMPSFRVYMVFCFRKIQHLYDEGKREICIWGTKVVSKRINPVFFLLYARWNQKHERRDLFRFSRQWRAKKPGRHLQDMPPSTKLNIRERLGLFFTSNLHFFSVLPHNKWTDSFCLRPASSAVWTRAHATELGLGYLTKVWDVSRRLFPIDLKG